MAPGYWTRNLRGMVDTLPKTPVCVNSYDRRLRVLRDPYACCAKAASEKDLGGRKNSTKKKKLRPAAFYLLTLRPNGRPPPKSFDLGDQISIKHEATYFAVLRCVSGSTFASPAGRSIG